MKKICLILIILVASVLVGIKIAKDPGYLLIIYGETSIETTLLVALIVAVIAFVLFIMIFKLLFHIFAMPQKIRDFRKKHQAKRSMHYMAKSLNELVEERWHHAETNIIKAMPGSKILALNYILAAKAAQQQKALARRDSYLRQAKASVSKNHISIELAQIHLQIAAKQWLQAHTNLQSLYQKNLARKHPVIIKLLYQVLLHLENWEQLLKIYPEIDRYNILTKQQLSQLEIDIFKGLLEQASKKNDAHHMIDTWKKMPRRLHKSPEIVAIYAENLIHRKQDQIAEHILTTRLKSQMDDQLITLYGQIKPQNPGKHLQHAEKWLRERPKHEKLLLTLAQICLEQQLWGKARSYLEQALAIKKSKQAYLLLAKLYEKLGQEEQALSYCREGLLMSS